MALSTELARALLPMVEMQQKEINGMSGYERQGALERVANELNHVLGLFGTDQEPLSDLLSAKTPAEMDRVLAEIMTPGCNCRKPCDHPFPPAFVRQVAPIAKKFKTLWLQVYKADKYEQRLAWRLHKADNK